MVNTAMGVEIDVDYPTLVRYSLYYRVSPSLVSSLSCADCEITRRSKVRRWFVIYLHPFLTALASRIDNDIDDGAGVKIALMLAIHVSDHHQRFATSSPGN